MTQPKFHSQDELYHIFVAYDTASSGGTQKVTLKSGKSCQFEVPPASNEDSKLPLKGCGLQGNDVLLVIHTWFDKSQDFEKSIDLLITYADIKPESRIRVRNVYELVKDARITQDLAALELLDFIVFSSKTESLVCQRYKVGRQNYRLIKLEQCIEDALAASKLDGNCSPQ